MKKFILYMSATFLLIGCGGGGGGTVTTTPTSTDIIVERGPVIGSYVVDNNGKRASNIGSGKYRFSTTPSYPIYVYGGYIDVNRDGVINGDDTALTFPLSVSEQDKEVITLLTTLAANSDIKNELLSTYNFSEDELFRLTPSTSLKVSAISDIVFKYCIENNSSIEDINITTFINTLETNITNTISQNETLETNGDTLVEIATANEIALIDDLNITLTDSGTDLTNVTNTITQSSTQVQDPTVLLDSLPTATLTQEEIDGLVFMYQEEKVARDVYTKMYEKWGLRIFNNISKAEQTHMDAVKAILIKYNIDIPVTSDTIGEFDLVELQTLYDTLIASGMVSSNEALKVGKLVEETDIADLIERLVDAPEDITLVYNSLLNGSYNHLNAFSKNIY
jgi:hypothetical protein